MRFHGAGIHPDDFGAKLFEDLIVVPELARLLGTARRLILRVEVQDDVLLAELLGEGYGLAGLRG